MSKSLKKTLLIVGIAAAVCAAVWGGLTLARNAQRGDVKVFDCLLYTSPSPRD